MPVLIAIILAVISGSVLHAQEKKVPKDSSRVSIPGCAKGRAFIVAESPEHEPVRSDVEPGRRFRLSGPKKLLEEIRLHESSMIEVTGLVRTSQLSNQGGVSVAGGRIRIGGSTPQNPIYADPRRDPLYNQVVMDVESWRQLPESCTAR
jgi:hypothetical protein